MLLLCSHSINAQNDRSYIRSGNRDYREAAEGAQTKAELKYRKAMSANGSNPQALYNLGCTLLEQKKDSAAADMFAKAASIETNKIRKAMCYHNMGVIMQTHKQFDQAIEAYKKSLRLNPKDNQTRYNLVLCQKLRKNQPNNKNNKNNKNDKNKDNKNKNDNKENSKNQQSKNKNQEDKKNSPQQQEQQQMSKENAEQLLNAAMQNEKATQQRLKKAMSQPARRNIQKNW